MVRRIQPRSLRRLGWWTPLALACLLIAVAPLAISLGAGASIDSYALVVLALLAIMLALLARAERRRLRCGER